MAVMARGTWTDERLDDLRNEVGMLRVEFRTEMRGLRTEIAAMHRSVNQLTFGLIGAMLTGFLATIAAILATAS